MAICWCIVYPNLFITLTYNTKWSEIRYLFDIIGKVNNKNRIEAICRVFKIKLHEVMHDLKHRK